MNNEKSMKKIKKRRYRTITAFFFVAVIFMAGVISSMYVIGQPSQEYKKTCESIDQNLSVCIAKFNLQKRYALEAKQEFNKTSQLMHKMLLKNQIYGMTLCKQKNLGYFMTEDARSIVCYDQNLKFYEFNMTAFEG